MIRQRAFDILASPKQARRVIGGQLSNLYVTLAFDGKLIKRPMTVEIFNM
jgi:hypothetical protein